MESTDVVGVLLGDLGFYLEESSGSLRVFGKDLPRPFVVFLNEIEEGCISISLRLRDDSNEEGFFYGRFVAQRQVDLRIPSSIDELKEWFQVEVGNALSG